MKRRTPPYPYNSVGRRPRRLQRLGWSGGLPPSPIVPFNICVVFLGFSGAWVFQFANIKAVTRQTGPTGNLEPDMIAERGQFAMADRPPQPISIRGNRLAAANREAENRTAWWSGQTNKKSTTDRRLVVLADGKDSAQVRTFSSGNAL